MKLTDDSIMTFGIQHKGKKLEKVPAQYLLYIYENYNIPTELKQYIIDNMDVIKMEIKRGL